MSIFASYVTRTVTIPGEDPETVTIQKLSAKHLAAARQAQVASSMEFVRTMGGAAFQRELAAAAQPELLAEQVAAVRGDPLRQYDRATILAKGVKAWTYTETVTPEALDDLTDDAADFLVREILTLTLPNGNAEKKTVS